MRHCNSPGKWKEKGFDLTFLFFFFRFGADFAIERGLDFSAKIKHPGQMIHFKEWNLALSPSKPVNYSYSFNGPLFVLFQSPREDFFLLLVMRCFKARSR
jgi:hypothetical protein